MPIIDPPLRPDEISIEPLDLIGHRERGHLSHIGFAWEAGAFSRDNEVVVVDARPVRRAHDKLGLQLLARLRLTRRERMLMTTWLRRWQCARTLAGDHVCFDAPLRDGPSGRVIGLRHSCATLVDACLRGCAGIELVDRRALPASDRARLQQIFGERAVEMAAFRGELPGEGPWTVLLPGHLFNALAREQPRAAPLRVHADDWDVR